MSREATEEAAVVSERYEDPTDKYPHGSYLKTIGDTVVCRTGRFSENDPQVQRLRESAMPWHEEDL